MNRNRHSLFVGLILCAALIGCVHYSIKNSRSSIARSIDHQNTNYYAKLAEACDAVLRLKDPQEGELYIVDSSNIATSTLPPAITDLKPDQMLLVRDSISISLGMSNSISWSREKANTNLWEMTTSRDGEEKRIYEEPSTKYCTAKFGLYDGAETLTPTNIILHQNGVMYAWEVTVYSRDEKVRIKEVVEQPGRGEWGGSPELPDGVAMSPRQLSTNEEKGTTVYDLTMKKDCRETSLIQGYRVNTTGPAGRYKISLFVNDQLVKVISYNEVDN